MFLVRRRKAFNSLDGRITVGKLSPWQHSSNFIFYSPFLLSFSLFHSLTLSCLSLSLLSLLSFSLSPLFLSSLSLSSFSLSLSFFCCPVLLGCMGKKRPKKKVMYSSHHSAEFECYDLVVYEPVAMVEDFTYKTLILIGQFSIKIAFEWGSIGYLAIMLISAVNDNVRLMFSCIRCTKHW